MNAFLALFAVAVLSAAAMLAVDASFAHRVGRWLIAWSYARRAARAEFDRCYQIWEEQDQ